MIPENDPPSETLKIFLSLNHPSIYHLLEGQLRQAYSTSILPLQVSQGLQKLIPLYRLKTQFPMAYRCSLPLQLAQKCPLSPSAIAQALLSCFVSPSADQIQLELKVDLFSSGIIDFWGDEQMISTWLGEFPQLFLSCFIEEQARPAISPTSVGNLFPLQYTHARCCSLLRLGHQEGLIELDTDSFNHSFWGWKTPDPIPWMSSSGGFNREKSAEYALIKQMMVIVDDINKVSPKNHLHLALSLSHAFWEFERHCRIFGEIKSERRELAQSRLGLLAITQMVLKWVIQEKFGLKAAREL